MRCKNCKADNKKKQICDAGIVCYVLRCGEYGCALNGKTVDKLLRLKKPITKADRIRSMNDEKLADFICGVETEGRAYGPRGRKAWIDWLKQEATHE